APNALLMVGGATTVIVAVLLVPPWPLSFELTLPVMLLWSPAPVPVTFTEKLHEPLAASVPPDKLMTLFVPVRVPPPQALLVALGVDKPPGRVSIKPTPVRLTLLFGLKMEKLKLVVPPTGMVVAPNALLMVGAAASVTVSLQALFPLLLSATTLLGS